METLKRKPVLCPRCYRGADALVNHPDPILPDGLRLKQRHRPGWCDGLGCSRSEALREWDRDRERLVAVFEPCDYDDNTHLVEVPSVEAAKAWGEFWGDYRLTAVGQMVYLSDETTPWEVWAVENCGFHDKTRKFAGAPVPAALAEYMPAVLERSVRRVAEQIAGTYAYRLTGLEPLAVKGHRRAHRTRTREYLRRLVNDLRAARKIRDDFQTETED